MLAEQAAQNAAKIEEAYGGLAQRASDFLVFLPPTLPSLSFFFSSRLTWIVFFFKLQ